MCFYGGMMPIATLSQYAMDCQRGAQMTAEQEAWRQANMRNHALLPYQSRPAVKPCPYCHRTDQKPNHKSCDGCGAPR